MGSVGRIGDDAVVRGPAPLQIVRPDLHRGRVVRLRVWFASAMWAPVLAANVLAIALGLTLPFLDEILGDRPSLPIAISAVEQLLGGLAAGMITFTGIVFSAVLVAAQLETTSYSPRLAARLRRDPVVIAALALPTATASYALFALAAVGRQANNSGEDVPPALTVVVGLLLLFGVLYVVFTEVANFGGGSGCSERFAKLQRAKLRSKRWTTERGLHVGDPSARLKQLHPEAKFAASYFLLYTAPDRFGNTGLDLPIVAAQMKGGAVRQYLVEVLAAGD